MKDYEDIIDLPYPRPLRHPRMSMQDRAAQFSPFAALTGYDAAIKESGRLTQQRREPDEDARQHLDRQLRFLQENLKKRPRVCLSYYEPDLRKEGGAYLTMEDRIMRIDVPGHSVTMESGEQISMEQILWIHILDARVDEPLCNDYE